MLARAALAAIHALSAAPVPARVVDPAPPFQAFQSRSIGYMVKDGAGVVWGSASTRDLPLYRLTPTGWTEVKSPGDFHRYTRLTMAPDGSLYGLLVNDGTQTGAVVHYTPSGADTLGTFPLRNDITDLLIDRDGTAWVTGQSREVRHILGHGQPDTIYTIPTNAFDSEFLAQGPAAAIRPVGSSMDGQGRIWLYSKPGEQSWLPSIHGMIVFNGETFTRIPSIFDAPNEPIEALVPRDKDHFWALYPSRGLMTIDTAAYTAEKVADPIPGAFRRPRQITRDGADWLLMTQENRPSGAWQGTLWKYHPAQTKSDKPLWTKLASGFEMSATWPEAPTPVAVTNSGAWIGDGNLGVWWFDRQTAKAKLVDWHHGFPLPGVSSLVKTQDGHIVAAHDYSIPVVLPGAAPPEIPSPDIHEHAVANLQTGLQPDGAGHLWGRRQGDRNTLDEWDGSRWIGHPLPQKIQPASLTAIVPDTRDRIWCIQALKSGIGLYDPASATWTLYDDLPTALVAHVGEPGFGFHTDWQYAPQIHDGRVAAYDTGPMYYDGKVWKSWQPQEITNTEYVNGMPYFDSEGKLAIRGSQYRWAWDGVSWKRGAKIPNDAPGELLRNRVVQVLQSLGWPLSSAYQVTGAVQGPGAIWFFIGPTLYVCRSGVVKPQFSNSAPNPFLQSPYLQEVRLDALGHLWLGNSRGYGLRYLELFVPQHTPFTLSLTTKSEDSVTATVTGEGTGVMIEWRIDDDPGVVTTVHTRVFANLPPGGHRVTAQPLNDHLLPIGPPMTISWQSTVTSGDQIRRLIATLATGSDSERTEAIDALARYGERATQDLLKARANASAGEQWWIDAALQEITNRTKNSKPEGTQE